MQEPKTCKGCMFIAVPHDDPPCDGCWTNPNKPNYTTRAQTLEAVPTSLPSQCGGCQWPWKENGCCQETTGVPDTAPTQRPVTSVQPRGLRYNTGKRRFDLLPPDALASLADILTIGAKKYAERNWELGMPYSDALGSLERHLMAWKAGEDLDPESGQSHLAHIATNAIFLLTWELRGVGADDRVKCGLPAAPANT